MRALSIKSRAQAAEPDQPEGVAPPSAEPTPSATGAESLVELRKIRYSYPSGPLVLNDVDLTIPAGSIIAMAGPSGCGKSTFLGIIAGYIQPDGGEVYRHPRLLARGKTGARPLTMVFQDDTVLPWKTVSANIAFGMRYTTMSAKEKKDRIKDLLGLARISEFADRYPYQLSGGQRRRVQFLTSVASGPQILLLDEPFSSLDEPTRLGVHRDVLNVIRELGTTVMIVTHDLGEAVSLSDELHLLTRRPATIGHTYHTPFPRERNVFELRETKEYLNLYRQVWHDLRQEIGGADNPR